MMNQAGQGDETKEGGHYSEQRLPPPPQQQQQRASLPIQQNSLAQQHPSLNRTSQQVVNVLNAAQSYHHSMGLPSNIHARYGSSVPPGSASLAPNGYPMHYPIISNTTTPGGPLHQPASGATTTTTTTQPAASTEMSEIIQRAARWLPAEQRLKLLSSSLEPESSHAAILPPTYRQVALELERAIHMLPPEHETSAYLRAVAVVPELVVRESDPMRFLRYHNYDVNAAAQGLARFWKRRCEIFGKRAFLPLTMTGEGALSTEDIECIKDGHYVFLPPDAQGRTVVCYDSSRRGTASSSSSSSSSQLSRLRAIFYLGYIVSENEKSQSEGFVSLSIIRSTNYDKEKDECVALILNTFPNKLKSAHMLDCRPEPSATSHVEPKDFVQGLFEHYRNLFLQYQTYIYPSRDKEKTVQDLKAHGLTRESLPTTVGGSWSYDRFAVWQIDRIQLERKLFSSKPQSSTTDTGTTSIGTSSQEDSKPPATDSTTTTTSISRKTTPSRSSSQTSAKAASVSRPASVGEEDSKQMATRPDRSRDSRGKTPGYLKECKEELEKEMDRLSDAETAQYRTALTKAKPRVWNEESKHERFLQAENFNAKSAAKRLARYWQLRVKHFGAKAFDSLYQTGEEALERRELSALGTGFLTLLPDDAQGCSVLFVDCSRLRPGSMEEARNRCFFYMFSLLAENAMSQNEGCVFLHKVEPEPFESIDVSFLGQLAQCMPLYFKSVHLLSSTSLDDSVASQISFGKRRYVHTCASKAEFLRKLEPFGLSKNGLPKCCNGSWGYEKFVQWQELRARMEFRIPVGLSGRESSEASGFPAIRPYSILPDEEKPERKRRLNVIHSRRKRDRERIERGVLHEHISELKEERGKLVQENRMLEDLTKASLAIASRLSAKAPGNHGGMDDILTRRIANPSSTESVAAPWQEIARDANHLLQQQLQPRIQQQYNLYGGLNPEGFRRDDPPLVGANALPLPASREHIQDMNHLAFTAHGLHSNQASLGGGAMGGGQVPGGNLFPFLQVGRGRPGRANFPPAAQGASGGSAPNTNGHQQRQNYRFGEGSASDQQE